MHFRRRWSAFLNKIVQWIDKFFVSPTDPTSTNSVEHQNIRLSYFEGLVCPAPIVISTYLDFECCRYGGDLFLGSQLKNSLLIRLHLVQVLASCYDTAFRPDSMLRMHTHLHHHGATY